jgi:peptidoglycan hydrolase CwlO-like protein
MAILAMFFTHLSKIILLCFFFLMSFSQVSAQSCDQYDCKTDDPNQYLKCIDDKMACLQEKIAEAQTSAVTLKSTINILSGQITVLQLQIDQSLAEITTLEKDILELQDRIEGLNYSLDKLTTVLVERINEHYKRTYHNPITILFSKLNFSAKISEFKYLKAAEQQTVDAMQRAESQKITYDEQRLLKEQKQQQLESKRLQLEAQKGELAQKKAAEQRLLDETKNNEAVFQQKLAEAKSEYEAQQDIIAGKGQETEVGHVDQGEKIASIIQGASCNSSGTHLHFTVSKSGISQNPFSYLKSGVEHINRTQSCAGVDQDSFNPTGSWEWPINQQIIFTQNFGLSSSLRCNAWVTSLYPSHNGLDIVNSSSLDVYSVKPGTLYRGSYYIKQNNCNLRYVRVAHDDDDSISTFYLHINY